MNGINNSNQKKKQNVQQKKLNQVPSPPTSFDFMQSLEEYKTMRNITASIPNSNQSNPNVKETSTIVISDDELEEGEIIDTPSQEYCNLINESHNELLRSQRITDEIGESSKTHATLFYEDKDSNGCKATEIPLYYSCGSAQTADNSNNVQVSGDGTDCLDTTAQSISDDSVIFVSEENAQLNKPAFLSPRAIYNIFSKVPFVENSNSLTTKKNLRSPRKNQRSNAYKEKNKFVKKFQAQQLKNSTPKVADQSIINISSSSIDESNSQNNNSALSSIIPAKTSENNSPSTSSSPWVVVSNKPKVPEKRIILIDGSNVAFGYTEAQSGKKILPDKDKDFSAEGLKIAIEFFENQGFQVKAVVPEYRVRREKSSNHPLMTQMKDAGKLIAVAAKSYDDLSLLKSALVLDAAIVSNDLFRDVRKSHSEYTDVFDKRQLRYNWVFNKFILTDDPYGNRGPKLNEILYK